MLNDTFAPRLSLRLIGAVPARMPVHPPSANSCRLMLAMLCLGGVVTAQEPAQMRADMLKLVLADSLVLTDQYERALAKLESELAAGADYEGARLVQQRREELKSVYASNGTMVSTAIPLPLDRVRLAGSVESRGLTLTGWRSAGSLAEWSGVKVSPGAYYLELEANITELPATAGGPMPVRSQPQEKASFVFYEVSLLPGAQENRRNFEITTADASDTFTPVRIGPLNFTRSSVTLRIAPTTGYPANAISLRQLRLVPVTADVIQNAPSLPEGDPLAVARAKLQSELAMAQKPVVSAYSEALQTLAAASAEMKESVSAETKRLEKLQEAMAGDPEAALNAMMRQPGGVGGFENIEDARLLPDETSSGDHFTVEHGGKRISVRLMWVRCAPLDEKSGMRREFAKHFDIEPDDTAALARAAREFTLGYLDGKPLHLLLRPMKDKDGVQPALVFLPEVGLYQNVLVNQGLAAVEPPPNSMRSGMMERGLFGTLLEHETAARREKNGAWALAAEVKP